MEHRRAGAVGGGHKGGEGREGEAIRMQWCLTYHLVQQHRLQVMHSVHLEIAVLAHGGHGATAGSPVQGPHNQHGGAGQVIGVQNNEAGVKVPNLRCGCVCGRGGGATGRKSA